MSTTSYDEFYRAEYAALTEAIDNPTPTSPAAGAPRVRVRSVRGVLFQVAAVAAVAATGSATYALTVLNTTA
jgi:hypothetical protein